MLLVLGWSSWSDLVCLSSEHTDDGKEESDTCMRLATSVKVTKIPINLLHVTISLCQSARPAARSGSLPVAADLVHGSAAPFSASSLSLQSLTRTL